MIAHAWISEFSRFIETYGISSYLVVPMRHEGQIIGTLGVARSRMGCRVRLDDQLLLQELADRAALAVVNAQLVDRLHTGMRARHTAEEKYGPLSSNKFRQ